MSTSAVAVRIHASSPSAVRAEPSLQAQLVLFCVVGVGSSLVYAALYVVLRAAFDAFWANACALVLSTVLATAADRRFTFGVRGPAGVLRHQTQGLILLVVSLATTSGSLALLHAASPSAGWSTEVAVLAVANLVVGVVRFVTFRVWVFAAAAPAPL